MSTPTTHQEDAVYPRRWIALVFLALAQLMIVLDVTIVNIALPSAQADLDITDGNRQWVITAYTLTFGGLLLLGGRIADYTGRRRTFMTGLIGFALASALGGAAPNFETLLAARALQGVFGALLAPSVLSLLTTLFTRARERAAAFGVFGAVAAGGGAVGLLLGGWLTEELDWRWSLYVNIPIAIIAAVGWFILPRDQRSGKKETLDIPGAVLAVGGLVSIVYAASEAESEGWDSGLVLGILTLGVALLGAFLFVESRVSAPLLPLRVLLNRTRGGAYLAVGLGVVGMFGAFLLLTYYMQVVKEYSPIETGLGFLPITAAVLISAGGISSHLIPRVAPRVLIVPGLLLLAAGMAWLTQLTTTSSYAESILPASSLIGFGMGLVMAPAINYATYRVDPRDAGVAAATVNTAQQVGGSIGTAVLNTIATSATAAYITDNAPQRFQDPTLMKDGLVDGFTHAFGWAAVVLVVAAVLVGVLMNTPRPSHSENTEEQDASSTRDDALSIGA